jgi:peptidoglycan hydrolase-like protein with peptidoglycan-binding domain
MSLTFCYLGAKGIGNIVTGPKFDEAAISASVGLGGGNRTIDVVTVQMLLNGAARSIGVPDTQLTTDGIVGPKTLKAIRIFQENQFGVSDGRVDPHQRTIRRLNDIAKGAVVLADGPRGGRGLGVTATPSTAPPSSSPTPTQKAFEALPLAAFWAGMAQVHLFGLLQAVFNLGGGTLPTDLVVFQFVNTHFHLDRDPANLAANLQKLFDVFGRIRQVLGNAVAIFKDGPVTVLPDGTLTLFADAPVGGFNLPGTPSFAVTFRPGYLTCGINCRAAMIVHECAHFVGGFGEIGHFAMEFPAPQGKPQGTSAHDYLNLTTSEAMRNASSYAAFAIHAATGVDSRFGASNLAL